MMAKRHESLRLLPRGRCCCLRCKQANKVSCVGVISHAAGGGVAASLSSSDLRGLLPEHFVSLATPVLAFLTAKASAGWAAQQKPHLPHMQQQQQQASPLPSPQQSPQYQQPQPQHAPQQQQQQAPQSPLHVAGSAHKWGLKVRCSSCCTHLHTQ